MTITALSTKSPAPEHRCLPRAAMQVVMRFGQVAITHLPLVSRNKFRHRINFRWRRGIGSLHYGNARRGDWISHTIHRWVRHYDPAGFTIPDRDTRDQRVWIVSDRFDHDGSYGTISATSQLAITAGCRFSGRLHDVFQLRVGDAWLGERWWPLAGHLQYCWECDAWICRRLARLSHRGKTLISQMVKGGTHVVEGRS